MSAEEKDGRRLVRPSQLPLYDETPEPRYRYFLCKNAFLLVIECIL